MMVQNGLLKSIVRGGEDVKQVHHQPFFKRSFL